MPNISRRSRVFYDGLSSFWQRLFADKETLIALYQGAEELLGQAYLDILDGVLNRSLTTASRFRKEYWKYLYLKEENQVVPPVTFPYVWKIDDRYRGSVALQNSILDPSVLLERGVDYDVWSEGGVWYIGFASDPANLAFDQQVVAVTTVVLSSGTNGTAAGSTFTDSAAAFDASCVGKTLTVQAGNFASSYTVTAVNSATSIAVNPAFPVGGGSHLSWKLLSKATSQRVGMWAVDACVEASDLYDTYGWLVDLPEPTVGDYTALLQGIYRLYTHSPSLARIEAALNVMSGFPVVASDGEIITSLTSDTVVTDKQTYELGTPRKDSLQVGDVLSAFTSLTGAYDVVDYLVDPSWFCGITLPDACFRAEDLPAMNPLRKFVSSALRLNQYLDSNATTNDLCYGDPGVFYGADYNGRSTGSASVAGLSYGFAYTVANTLLKYNAFGIFPRVPEALSVSDIQKIVRETVPSYTFVYVEARP